MNRTYQTVWNPALGVLQVASERTRRGSRGRGTRLACSGLSLSALLVAPLVQALPENGSSESLADLSSLSLERGLDWSLAGAWARSSARGVEVADESTLQLNGVISGSGAISKTGNGTLVLAGANTFSGALSIAGGTLVAASNTALGSSAGTVTVNGGQSRLEVQSGVALSNQTIDLKNGATLVNEGRLVNTLSSANSYGVGGTSAQGNVENYGHIRGTRAGVALAGNSSFRELHVLNSGADAEIIGMTTSGGGSGGNGITLAGGSAVQQITAYVNNLDGATITGNSGGYGIQATDYVTTNVVNSASNISGGVSGITLGGRNSTLSNLAGATLTSTGSYAVELRNGGSVSNDGQGSLLRAQTTAGGGSAVNISGYAGAVFNSNGAVIRGGSVSGVGINLLSGSVSNLGGALIESGGNAVQIAQASGQALVINQLSSIISSSGRGVSITGKGVVENLDGIIQGWHRGVVLGGGGSVLNQGRDSRISALRNDRLEPPNAAFGDPIRVTGLSIQGGAGQVENLDGASIYGYTRGVWLEAGGSVLNAGQGSLIEGERNFGVVISGGLARLENLDGAVIRGGVPSSSSNGSSAVVAFGAGGDLVNRGKGSVIGGDADVGVLIQCSSGCNSSSLYNTDGAQIAGGIYGVYLSSNVPEYRLPNGQFTTLNPDAANYSLQLVNRGSGSLISARYGLVTSSSLAEVYNLDGARIEGTERGVGLYGGGTLINDRFSSIGGGIEGAVVSSGAAVTLHNEGLIEGNVALSGEFGNTVYLYEGARLLGDLDLGQHTASQLLLNGDGRQLYSQAVTGSTQFDGTLIKRGSGFWNLDSDLGHTGQTLVEAGTLAVNSSIASSSFTIREGARLGGRGQVGSTLVERGAILAPGNSIGTLTVNGDLTLAPGSIFEVELDANGNSDQVVVSGGTAYLNGSTLQLRLLSPNSDYRAGVQSTLLTADAIVGSFDEVLGNPFAFLDFSFTYDSTSVSQSITRNSTRFADLAHTRNQVATADALDGLGASSLYGRVSALTREQAPNVFDNLSGELHASLTPVLVDDGRLLRDGALQRLATDGTAPNGVSVWSQVSGERSRIDGDGNAASVGRELTGLSLGADVRIQDWTLGALAGVSDGSVTVSRRDSSARTDGYHLGGYAGRSIEDLRLRFGVSHSWYGIDSRRDIDLSGTGQRLKARQDARVAQAFAEVGRVLEHEGTRIEPYIGLAQLQVRQDGFRERGGDARLRGRKADSDLTLLGGGVRIRHERDLAGLPLEMSAGLSWQHALGQRGSDRDLSFEGGESFRVRGVDVPRDVVQASIQSSLELVPDLRLGLGYSGQLSGEGQGSAIQASLRFDF